MVKRFLKRILRRRPSNEELIEQLKAQGAQIGDRLHLYGTVHIDTQFPFMLSIGNDVEITTGVHILNHDYSWSVIKKATGQLLGGVGPVDIGNNVFIGSGSLILMNTHIGNNTIVGARSVVSGTFPDNVVIAGTPAKVICSLDEFIEKRQTRQLREAIEIVKHYRKAYGKNPSKEYLPAYFWLFEPRDKEIITPIYKQRMELKGTYDLSIKLFHSTKPLYENFESFLDSIPFENM